MNEDTLKLEKAGLRQRLKAARGAISEADRLAWSDRITDRLWNLPAVCSARSVFVFVSNSPEVHTHALIDRLLAAGKSVYVPKILARTRMIACPFHDWGELRPAGLGILTPVSDEAHENPVDVVITPGLGFTVRGDRIGFGAGYYDRWFAGHRVGARIAVAFECQIVDEIPTGVNDLPVDVIVTERRVITVSAT